MCNLKIFSFFQIEMELSGRVFFKNTIVYTVFGYGFLIKYSEIPIEYKQKANCCDEIITIKSITKDNEEKDICECIRIVYNNLKRKFNTSGIEISARVEDIYDRKGVYNTVFFIHLKNQLYVSENFETEVIIDGTGDISTYDQRAVTYINSISKSFGKENKWIMFLGRF